MKTKNTSSKHKVEVGDMVRLNPLTEENVYSYAARAVHATGVCFQGPTKGDDVWCKVTFFLRDRLTQNCRQKDLKIIAKGYCLKTKYRI